MRTRNFINETRARNISVTLIFVTVATLLVGSPQLGYVSAEKNGSGNLRGRGDKPSPDWSERLQSKAVGFRVSDPMARAQEGGALDEQRAAALKKLSVE